MLHPLGSLFNKVAPLWQERDLRYFIERYLRQRVQHDAVYCDSVTSHIARVRVNSPALHQAVVLLEADLKAEVKTAANYQLASLRVKIEY